MVAGLSTANLIVKILNHIKGSGATAFTAPTQLYVRLHTADPGATGILGVPTGGEGGQTGQAINFSTTATNVLTMSNTPSWSITVASQTASHISIWDASTAGNFLWSAALTASKSVVSGDTLTLTSCTLTLNTPAS
jgi:hypothetical protein